MYFDLALSFQFACNYPLSAQPCCRVYPGLERPLVPLGFCQSGSFRFVCVCAYMCEPLQVSCGNAGIPGG